MLLLASLCLQGCASLSKQAFDSKHHPDIHNIVISKIEFEQKITLRRYNPIYAIIGVSGLITEQLAMEQKSARYKARVGDVVPECKAFILQQIVSGLQAQGYHVETVKTGYWQTLKRLHTAQLADADAIMRVRIKRLGFRAESINAAYQPSIMLSVELIETGSRKVLYKKDLGIGYKPSGYRLTSIEYDRSQYTYPSLINLLQHAKESKQGIFIALSHTAEQITHDLRKQPSALPVNLAQGKGMRLQD